jgi:uncharacterized membrane protein
MNITETLTTSDTQEIVPSVYSSVYFVLCFVYPMLPLSLCCSFLIVPSGYSSVYFVMCLVYPMLPVSLCCSFLIVPSVWHWQHQIHKTQDKINTRVTRRNNEEWTTQRQRQHRIHITLYKINTRVNQCLCVVHSWLSLLFTLVFILFSVLCIRCCHCLCVVHSWLFLLVKRTK